MGVLPGIHRGSVPGCSCIQFAPTEDAPRRHHPECDLYEPREGA